MPLTLAYSSTFDRGYLIDTVIMVPIEEAEQYLELKKIKHLITIYKTEKQYNDVKP